MSTRLALEGPSGLVGDEYLSGQDQRGDRRGVLQCAPGDLNFFDNTGFDHVDVIASDGVKSVTRRRLLRRAAVEAVQRVRSGPIGTARVNPLRTQPEPEGGWGLTLRRAERGRAHLIDPAMTVAPRLHAAHRGEGMTGTGSTGLPQSISDGQQPNRGRASRHLRAADELFNHNWLGNLSVAGSVSAIAWAGIAIAGTAALRQAGTDGLTVGLMAASLLFVNHPVPTGTLGMLALLVAAFRWDRRRNKIGAGAADPTATTD